MRTILVLLDQAHLICGLTVTPRIRRHHAEGRGCGYSSEAEDLRRIVDEDQLLRVFSSGTQSSIWSSSRTSFGIGLKYCGCGQSEPQSSRVGACATSFSTSGSVSEKGHPLGDAWRSFSQQRPVSADIAAQT